MSVTDLMARKKWNTVPKHLQQQLVKNVFCSKCMVTTIVDFSIHSHELGIILKGKCKECKGNVARVIPE